MTREIFKSYVMAMINNSEFEKLVDKAMNCGAIDIDDEHESDFLTRKALCYVILRAAADNWMPLTKAGKEEVKNLERFI